MPVSVFILFSRVFSFLADAVPFVFFSSFSQTPFRLFSCLVLYNTIRLHLKLLARDLMSDVCFFSIQVMYIDVVPDKVIWTVNWLYYLNYEPIARSSSTCYLFCTRNNLGHAVTPSYQTLLESRRV